MSVIIAVKKDDTVYLGADTQITCGTSKINVTTGANTKLFTFDNGVIIGYTGSSIVHQIIIANPEWLDFKNEDEFTKEYLITKFIPKLKEAMQLYNYTDDDFAFLIVYKSKIYQINEDYTVFNLEHALAIGSGSTAIRLKLSKLNINDDIESQILEALRFSAQNNSAVGAPFRLVNTKDLKTKIIEE